MSYTFGSDDVQYDGEDFPFSITAIHPTDSTKSMTLSGDLHSSDYGDSVKVAAVGAIMDALSTAGYTVTARNAAAGASRPIVETP